MPRAAVRRSRDEAPRERFFAPGTGEEQTCALTPTSAFTKKTSQSSAPVGVKAAIRQSHEHARRLRPGVVVRPSQSCVGEPQGHARSGLGKKFRGLATGRRRSLLFATGSARLNTTPAEAGTEGSSYSSPPSGSAIRCMIGTASELPFVMGGTAREAGEGCRATDCHSPGPTSVGTGTSRFARCRSARARSCRHCPRKRR